MRNSLTQALPAGEMLAIAEQTQVLPAVLSAQGRRSAVSLRAAAVRYAPVGGTEAGGLRQTLGGAAGLTGLVLVAALGALALRRRRTVAELRAGVQAHLAREGQLHAGLRRRPPAPRPPVARP